MEDRDAREPPEPPLPPAGKTIGLPAASLEALGGDYRLSADVVLHVAAAKGGLTLSHEGGTANLAPASPTEFVARNGGARLHFDGDASGRPRRLILLHDGRHFECPREER